MAEYEDVWCKKHQVEARLDPRCVFDLGQSAKYKTPKAPGPLATFKHASGVYFMPMLGRWILPLERALAMGFPCTADAAASASVHRDFLTCSESNASGIGNSFHVANAGAVLLAVLCSLGHPLPAH